MSALNEVSPDLISRFGDRLSLPEYRQVELYTKKKTLVLADPAEGPSAASNLLGAVLAFTLLDAHLEGLDESLEGKTTWQRYLALPRGTHTQKLVAEVYRVLRILRQAMVHQSGRIAVEEGILVARVTLDRTAVALHISAAGLGLLESFVAYHLDSPRQPYGDAYVEGMLGQYFTDIVGEIKRFADEDRVLYQFRQRGWFNRHFRLDCDNPKFKVEDGAVVFEIGAPYADPTRHPIDFFVVVDGALHIVPVEALSGGAIAWADLARWRARDESQRALPAHFRQRFGRETMTPGLPMW